MPAPKLSPEHLHFARSAPINDIGTPSSGFLTPPVSAPHSMSPPPREEVDDYLNARSHGRHRKRAGRQSRHHRNTVEEVEVQGRALRSPKSTTRSIGVRSDSCSASSMATEGESVSDAPFPPKSMEQLKLNTNVPSNPQDTSEFDTVRVPTWSTFNVPGIENRDVESPAVNALRSLSQPLTLGTESRILRRMSTALAATFGFLTPGKDSMDSSKTTCKRSTASREEGQHRNNFSERDCPSRRTTFKGPKSATTTLEIPATITLRKASNMFMPSPVTSSLSASIINGDAYKPDPLAPTSELLAFYATPVVSRERPQRLSGPSPKTSNPSSSVQVETSWNQAPFSRSELKKSISMAQFNGIDCYSSPAESTLTFTDVHTAPGSFAVESRSRKQSLSFSESFRRMNFVHFRSRNSVHEVIWREDDATSGSSFASDSSSSPNQESRAKSPTLCPQSHSRSVLVEQGDDAGLRITSFPDKREINPEESLFQWSWSGPPASAKNFEPTGTSTNEWSEDAVPKGGTNGAPTNRRNSSSPLCSKPSASELCEARSVRQLRKRSSTSEWRRIPLEDSKGPVWSNIPRSQEQNNTYFAGAGAGIPRMQTFGTVIMATGSERVHGTFSGRRMSPHPHTLPRAGPRGSAGSSIGASSHIRILPMNG